MKTGNNATRWIALFFVVAIVLVLLNSGVVRGIGGSTDPMPYQRFLGLVQTKPSEIKKIIFHKDELTGQYAEGATTAGNQRSFAVVLPDASESRDRLYDLLNKQNVNFEFKRAILSDWMQSLLSMLIFPAILLGLLWILFMRQAQSGGNQAMNFGRSRAKRLSESVPKITFEEVAGVEEAKQELQEIVEFLKNARKFQALGAKIPKGVLLLGPPGCGKTMLARAVAGEAGVPFFHISGSDFVEMFVGVGASRVRDLFETAKNNRPSLIFIDEIDAVGRQRGAGLGGGHDEREQTLNQLLVEMDGFDPNSGVIMIAATNRADVLDPALLRPGRFDRRIVVDAPDVMGRKEIFKVHLRGKPLEDNVDVETLSKLTPGFTGADIMNVVNEAAILAARRDKTRISMSEFDEARDRVMMGPERRTRMNSPRTLKVVAYHELGHAIVSANLPHSDLVYKITIVPRGLAGGLTWYLPKDESLPTRQEMLDDIASSLGGRIAEEIVFGDVTTGASSDLNRATDIARAMVCDYGMTERLGMVRLGRRQGSPFLGRDLMEDRDYSEDVAKAIDEEVRAIIDGAYERARSILLENRAKMDEIAEVLLEKETLSSEEFLALLHGTASVEDVLKGNIKPPAVPPMPPSLPSSTEQDGPTIQPRMRPEPA